MLTGIINIGTIARKDFSDLATNYGVLVVIFVYLIAMAISIVDVRNQVSGGINNDSFVSLVLGSLTYVLMVYGGIFAVLIGFWSISSDMMSHSINTLLVKPVYRDTVINGKLLGSTLFMFCVFLLTSFLYVFLLLLIFGGRVESVLLLLLYKLPVVLVVSLVVAMTFLCLSMLVSTLLSGKSVALLVNILLFVVLNIAPTMGIAGNLAPLFGDNRQNMLDAVSSLSPRWNVESLVYYGLFDPAMSVVNVLSSNVAVVFKLLLGLLVLLILNYVVFLRRDIA